MAQRAQRPRRKPRQQHAPKVAPLEQQTRLSPDVPRQINMIFLRFWLRMAAVFLLVSSGTVFVLAALRLPPKTAQVVLFASAFGVMLPFWRGLDKLFDKVADIAKERLKEHRFADARYALDLFHKLGNMSFDRDGERHYLLTQALLGLGDIQAADKMATWIARNRKTGPYVERAVKLTELAKKKSNPETELT